MKLYLAGLITNDMLKGGKRQPLYTDVEKAHMAVLPHCLESYHYLKTERQQRKWHVSEKDVFMDSGAFSAFTLGIKVNVDQYVQFLHKNMPLIHMDEGVACCSVLDAVGDAKATYDNQKAMESSGIMPLPCFHYGEPIEYLKYYMDNYPYITIGGMVPISTKQLIFWLDELWEKYLAKPDGTARLKVHGFGVTKMSITTRYPWHSVDSSSWVQAGNMGNIVIYENNRLYYITVSKESPLNKIQGRHYSNMQPEYREIVLRHCADFCIPPEDLVERYIARRVFNCCTYKRVGELVNPRFEIHQGTVFDFI